MSQQALDLRRSIQIVRRHRILVGVMVVLGLLGGVAYAMLKPPMFTSTALIALPRLRRTRSRQDGHHYQRRPIPLRRRKWWSRAVIQCFRALCMTSVHRYRSLSCVAKLRSRARPPVSFR